MNKATIKRHAQEWEINAKAWENKPELRDSYKTIYHIFKDKLNDNNILEIGSGMAKSKIWIPNLVTSDREQNPWVDRVESAYKIDSPDNTWGHVIMLDVWHHLERPSASLKELHRVLKPKGTLLLIEPDISLLGWLVYGLMHKEPVDYFKKFSTDANPPVPENYYARQSSAHRMFLKKESSEIYKNFHLKDIKRFPMLSYVLTGGFSGPNLLKYIKPPIKFIEKLLEKSDRLTQYTSTRILVELEKK